MKCVQSQFNITTSYTMRFSEAMTKGSTGEPKLNWCKGVNKLEIHKTHNFWRWEHDFQHTHTAAHKLCCWTVTELGTLIFTLYTIHCCLINSKGEKPNTCCSWELCPLMGGLQRFFFAQLFLKIIPPPWSLWGCPWKAVCGCLPVSTPRNWHPELWKCLYATPVLFPGTQGWSRMIFLSPGVTHTPKITQPATDPCRNKVDEAITTQDERW